MRVLLTGADTALGAALGGGLAAHHEVIEAGMTTPLAADERTRELVSPGGTAVEAIVHLGPLEPGDSDSAVDYATRRTYNLLREAADVGVERLVTISTLRVMDRYLPHLTVTENWRPQPSADDAAALACHLSEVVAKEFARDCLLPVVVLRLGFPLVAGPREGLDTASGTAATAVDDVIDAVHRALRAPLGRYHTIHVQSPINGARFLMHAAGRLLGFPDGDLPAAAPVRSGV